MKRGIFLLVVITLLSFDDVPKAKNSKGLSIITKSQTRHDPNNEWQSAEIHWRLQEPRLSNPQRFSEVQLNNKNGTFQLIRNRDEHLSTHIIDEKGNAKTLFNGTITTDEEKIKKYRLDPNRNKNYRSFYQIFFGLPMSLTNDKIEHLHKPKKTIFNNRKAYRIKLRLKEAVFSKDWSIYIARENYEFLGFDIHNEEEPEKGERLIFDGSIKEGTTTIHRIQHWYDLEDAIYLGSDIIVKSLKE